MRKSSNNINRRSFVGITGTAAAGITFLPSSLFDAIVKDGNGWWEKEPLRIIEFEQGYEFSEKFDLLKDMGANMEHVTRFTDTSPGTSFLDAHNLYSGKKINFGSLKEYLAEAKKREIRVVIYYNVHAIAIDYARQHSDWQQVKADGKPIEDVYTVDSSFCINSPWRDEVFQTLRKLAAYEIDGIFYDGPIFFAGTCYCESCKRKFREKYLKDLPSKAELASNRVLPEWREIIEFQSDSIAEFLRESNKIIKENNPQILFYMNGNTLAPSWPTGRNNRKIARETDILGAEGGFLYGEFKEPVYKPGAMGKLLETQSGGKPTVVFDNAKQGPWAFSSLPAGEISILYSQTITSQANVWLSVSAASNLHPSETDVIKKYNRLIKDNPDPFIRTTSMAGIALVWPQNSGNYYSGSSVPLTDFTKEMKPEKAGSTEEEFYGFYNGLARGHFPFDVLDEEALNSDPGKYQLIILPNVTCLSKSEAEKIRNYVRNGGNIISTFETSLYDATGKKLDNFELRDIFGTDNYNDIFGPLNWDYISPEERDHFSLKEIRNRYLNAPTYGVKIRTQAKVPVFFSKPLPGSYAGSPEISDLPFMVENTYGKGRSIYLAGTFGGSLKKFHFPEYYQLLNNIVSEFCKPVLRLENAPSSVEVSLRRNENCVFIYLINFTSEMKRPIQKIISCPDIRIEVTLAEKVKSLKSLCQKQSLQFTNTANSVSFVLPVLEDYEVLKLEL
jgi:hypothetical protein